MKSKFFYSVLLIITSLMSSCHAPKGTPESQFVTVRDGHFYIGDKEYRYVGTNFWYGAILASEGQGSNRDSTRSSKKRETVCRKSWI